jgi:hypothetical protein
MMATKQKTITAEQFAKFYTLGEISDKLKTPFNLETIYWKPQSTTKDGKRAMGAPYADTRAYEDRLNAVCPEQWTTLVTCIPTQSKLVCIVELSVCGIVRCGDGDAPNNDSNMVTSAYSQAFKRACSRFGLGRYLYNLPKTWVEFDKPNKRITPKGVAQLERMYLQHTRKPTPKKEEPPKEPTPQPEPPLQKKATPKKPAPPKKKAAPKKKAPSKIQAKQISADGIKHITDTAAELLDDNGQQRYVLTIKKVRDNLMSALAINPRPFSKLSVREGGLIYWYLQSQLGKTGEELATTKECGKVIAGYAQKDSLKWDEAEVLYKQDMKANNGQT